MLKIAAVIVGLFIAGLAYLEYQKIISVDWVKFQAISQSGLTTIANRLGGMKKQLNDTIFKMQMMHVILGRHYDAANALIKLQFLGIAEDQILRMCRNLEANAHNSIPNYAQSHDFLS